MASSRKKEKTILPSIIVLVVVAVLLLIAVLTNNRPSTLRVDLEGFYGSRDGHMALVRDNELSHEDFLVRNDIVYTSLNYLTQKLNRRFYYDQAEELLLYTLPGGTREADLRTLFGEAPVLLKEQEKIYVQLAYVQQYTAMTWELTPAPRRLVMKTKFGDYGQVETLKDAIIRSGPSPSRPIMTEVPAGEKL